MLSSAPMNKDEIYDLFLAVLNVHGFTAIPGEEVVKIVQQVDAKQSAEILDRFPQTPSEQLITRVIQIDNANALELVPILRPLVAKVRPPGRCGCGQRPDCQRSFLEHPAH